MNSSVYMIVSDTNLEEFTRKCTNLLRGSFVPHGSVSTLYIEGTLIHTVRYTQPFIYYIKNENSNN